MKPTYEQLEQQLAESQREFRSADATIENLQMQVEKLAAENSAVKAMNDCLSEELREYESDGAFEGPKMHLLWWKAENPATDAALAEVRAQGIDSIVNIKLKQLADMHPDTHAFGATAMSIRSQINELQVFAAQLRQGGAA